jgi:uncharacterized protein (DUF433 family)
MPDPDLLSTGIYTVSEAAALLGVTKRRIRGWVAGYEGTKRSPLIDNELGSFGRVNGRIAFSFANLMEMKFITFFEDAGLKPSYVRSIFVEMRRLLHTMQPFATKSVFRTDGMKIMEDGASASGKILYDLKTHNYEMRTVVIGTLMEDVIYDAAGNARSWYPRQYIAPNVIIHPRFAFGRPVLRDSAIPTRTIADAVKAERKFAIRSVATWYDVPEKQVREAVRFEDELRKAA